MTPLRNRSDRIGRPSTHCLAREVTTRVTPWHGHQSNAYIIHVSQTTLSLVAVRSPTLPAMLESRWLYFDFVPLACTGSLPSGPQASTPSVDTFLRDGPHDSCQLRTASFVTITYSLDRPRVSRWDAVDVTTQRRGYPALERTCSIRWLVPKASELRALCPHR